MQLTCKRVNICFRVAAAVLFLLRIVPFSPGVLQASPMASVGCLALPVRSWHTTKAAQGFRRENAGRPDQIIM